MYKEIDYPRAKKKGSDVQVVFRLRGAYAYAYLYVSLNPDARKVSGFQAGDRIRVFVDDENPRKWCLRKSDDQTGYLLTANAKGNLAKIVFLWTYYIPEESEKITRNVAYRVTDQGLEIDASL